jgi:heme/copper-type cytochrome/quinol oxidase subunit 4
MVEQAANGPGREGDSDAQTWRLLAVAGAVVFAITVVGGEGFGWTWTGYADNNTLWDWLHLLILPVVLAVAPVWYRTRRTLRAEWRIAAAITLTAFAITILGGYLLGWTWTGFDGRTLWDWLELLVLPTVVTALPIWLSLRRSMQPRLRAVLICLLIAFALLVTAGYSLDWAWTGFEGNTLWDWLHLLLVPFVLPVALTWFTIQLERPDPAPDPSPPPGEATAPARAG